MTMAWYSEQAIEVIPLVPGRRLCTWQKIMKIKSSVSWAWREGLAVNSPCCCSSRGQTWVWTPAPMGGSSPLRGRAACYSRINLELGSHISQELSRCQSENICDSGFMKWLRHSPTRDSLIPLIFRYFLMSISVASGPPSENMASLYALSSHPPPPLRHLPPQIVFLIFLLYKYQL